MLDRFGEVALLMNNAGTGGGGSPWQNCEGWRHVIDVDLWGVIHGLQVFTQGMIDQGTPSAIVNTGSKQGITKPPGDAAYARGKAGIKSLTESLAHQLRGIEGRRVSAHLLVPGFTCTGLVQRFLKEKPPSAWLPGQVADHLLAALERGDFYVLCSDDDVTPEMDQRRIEWAAGDLTENRPALSRWHPDYEAVFADFMAEKRDWAMRPAWRRTDARSSTRRSIRRCSRARARETARPCRAARHPIAPSWRRRGSRAGSHPAGS